MSNLLKQTTKLLNVFLIAIIFFSCQQEELTIETNEIKQTENFVSFDDASAIASVIEYPIIPNSNNAALRASGVTTTFKNIERVLEIPNKNGTPSYYIVNYEDNGFVIISADNRTNPIRAFSLTKKFPIESEELPNGLIGWLIETEDMIQEIRVLDAVQTEAVAKTWDNCEIQMTIQLIDDGGCDDGGGGGGGCQNTYVTVGPLLNSTWGQRGGYNNLVEFNNCNDGTTPTGCVATAMGQIMYYHEFPTNYAWNLMEDDFGTPASALLLRDIGLAVNMNYSCTALGASMEDATSAFSNNFNYQNASFGDFNHTILKQQLGWNRPVMLSGYQDQSCFLWWCSYETGHAWVCDGYKSTYYCESGTSYLYLHMNWGWDGTNNDTYFAYNNWNPGNFTFNYNKKMIYNIRP